MNVPKGHTADHHHICTAVCVYFTCLVTPNISECTHLLHVLAKLYSAPPHRGRVQAVMWRYITMVRHILLKSAHSHGDLHPHLIQVPSAPKQRLSQLSHFCTAHLSAQCIDRHTHIHAVCNICTMHCVKVMWPNNSDHRYNVKHQNNLSAVIQ